jgi:hypothetical protein
MVLDGSTNIFELPFAGFFGVDGAPVGDDSEINLSLRLSMFKVVEHRWRTHAVAMS